MRHAPDFKYLSAASDIAFPDGVQPLRGIGENSDG
jgi:hypothetical protein